MSDTKLYLWRIKHDGRNGRAQYKYLSVTALGVKHHADAHKADVYPVDSEEGSILEDYREASNGLVTRRASRRKSDRSLGGINITLNSSLGTVAMLRAQADRLQAVTAHAPILKEHEYDLLQSICVAVERRIADCREQLGITAGGRQRDR